MTRRRSAEVKSLPDHLSRELSWNGLRPGDRVDVEGAPGRQLRWEFKSLIRNTKTGDESVEVVGGRPGERTVRSFEPGRVYAVGGARAGRLSLADAPMLPFD